MSRPRSAFDVLLAAAAVVVVLAGLRAARTILLPFLFALVLAILMLPLVLWMEKRLPRAVAILSAVLTVLAVLLGVATFTGQSLQEFGGNLPEYQAALTGQYLGALAWLEGRGVNPGLLNLEDSFDPGAVMSVVGSTLNGVLDILSNTILVTITMAFILAEASAFPDKLARAFPVGDPDMSGWQGLITSVQRYLFLKSMTSVLTGVLVSILLGILGVDSALLWGFFAFVLNFIPTLGSIIAAVPAVLLSLILIGPGTAAIVSAGYLAINISIGNVVEPRLMGDQLGLSPLMVFLSLVFWGWLWGPAGMLLSVPLTVVVRSVMAHRPETAWLATLLGPNRHVS